MVKTETYQYKASLITRQMHKTSHKKIIVKYQYNGINIDTLKNKTVNFTDTCIVYK